MTSVTWPTFPDLAGDSGTDRGIFLSYKSLVSRNIISEHGCISPCYVSS